ncbi:OPT family oligopeptide transporter [Thermodesulfobacteriota bacterium]
MAELQKNVVRVIRRGPYPELSWQAILVGYGIGAVLSLSFGYACLILGFSIEGSELAAILGFVILRGIMRRNSIVENNINQTIASGVNGATAGMMFSVPALFILGHHEMLNPIVMVFSCIAGAVLGIAFIIPLRKQMIDYERLAFPGGIAVASILKSPGAGVTKAKLLVGGALLSGLIHFLAYAFHFENWYVGDLLGLPEYLNVVIYISLMTIGVGFIAGKGGIYFIVGGYTCYWILSPILSGMGLLPSAEAIKEMGTNMPGYLRVNLFRPAGIGMLIGGALTGIVLALPLITGAIKSMQSASKMKMSISKDELPIKMLYIAIGLAFVLLFILAVTTSKQVGVLRGGLIAILGTLWIWMAGVILSECIGRTNWSPLSGMTLIAVTIFIVLTRGIGDSSQAIAVSILVGAAACVAMAQATDLMLDLKTGYLVGASPRKQQIGQFLGTWLGPVIIMFLIFILHKAYGLGSDKLPAPQGQALASMISGILGGDVPVQKYIAGAGIGALLSASGIGGLGILVGLGFYLPFNIVITYSFGTVSRLFADKKYGVRFSEERGIPFATGLIVGEALIGVVIALIQVISAAK